MRGVLGEHHRRGFQPLYSGRFGYSNGMAGTSVVDGVHRGRPEQGPVVSTGATFSCPVPISYGKW
jgi:hypothetical protein